MNVDVVVVCHRQEEFLSDCLDSIFMQTNLPSAVHVIRDEKWRSLPEKLLVGVGASNRSGFVVPVAADDILDVTFIEKTGRALSDTPGAVAAYTDIQRFGDEDSINESPEWPVGDLAQQNRLPGTAIFRRETLHQCLLRSVLDGGWCDWGVWIELDKMGAKCVRVPEPLLLYRRHAGNASANRTPEEEAEMYERIRRNHL